ncbi:MAG: circadian clock protein KaiC [Candidatus Lokiarchaeota archaeon]|nr:circadian clock protein KaiC [Candidatus Lokiarchaeota archaeon]MBD3343301.1 circadian clock protein KaiC [Candidatus Lokiarchaeota archaeon]
MQKLSKIPSGIEGFDYISKGGIPLNRTTLISGTPGSGKTIFCVQFLIGGIENANQPGVFVTFEESPQDIVENMIDFGWDIQKHIDNGLWKFVDISPYVNDDFEIKGDYDLSGLLIRIKSTIKKIGAKRVALDSLAALFNQFPDSSIVRKEILRLKTCLKSLSVTSLITSEYYEDYPKYHQFEIVDFVSDNLIILKNSPSREYRRRTIEILKYRGSDHRKGQHSFTIRADRGIVIISFERQLDPLNINTKRVSSGLEDLDEILGGGLFQGSTTLISGQTGTGKTLLLLSMLNGLLQKGEKCIMFNFEESREQILKKALLWNIDLEKAERGDQFRLYNIYPESQEIEDLIIDVKTKLKEFSPNRVFIDSISALERITTEITYRESLINMLLYFREMNIIGFLTSTSPAVEFTLLNSQEHISTLSDAIILLRYFERDGKIGRALAIMKIRDSDHSKYFLEYKISDNGVSILSPIKQNMGIFKTLNV